MSLVASTYRSPLWLPGAHLQTIVPARMMRRPTVAYQRERWETPDGDFVDVDFTTSPARSDAPQVVLFHGLEGNSRSHYAVSIMARVVSRGWRGCVVHFRGCSGEPNRLARAYHSGDADEIDWIVRRLAQRCAPAPLFAIGISLGGNALVKWLGERENDAAFVRAAAAIGAPLDLAAGGAALGRGFNRLYTQMFMTSLRPKAIAKARRFGNGLSVERIAAARNLYEFDNAYTAPVHGFASTEDYWARASGKPWLTGISVPTLVVNARNDPFVPAASLPGPTDASPAVRLEQPAHGGHIGFVDGAFPGRLDWIGQRALAFFDQMI